MLAAGGVGGGTTRSRFIRIINAGTIWSPCQHAGPLDSNGPALVCYLAVCLGQLLPYLWS